MVSNVQQGWIRSWGLVIWSYSSDEELRRGCVVGRQESEEEDGEPLEGAEGSTYSARELAEGRKRIGCA